MTSLYASAAPRSSEPRNSLRGKRPPGLLTVADLPWIIATVLDREGVAVLPGYDGAVKMSMRHLRRKPGKGLLAVYNVRLKRRGRVRSPAADARPRPAPLTSVKGWAWCSNQLLTVTLGEPALDGNRIRFDPWAVEHAPVEHQAPGVLTSGDLALTIQVFPSASGWPALAGCFDTQDTGPLFSALEKAARTQLADGAWQLTAARAEVLRYKPGVRCLVLYELALRHHHHGTRRLVICGKAYADRAQVSAVTKVLEDLYVESQRMMDRTVAGHTIRTPLVPKPLGLVDELGLQLSEMVEAGADPWSPRVERGPDGAPVKTEPPAEALRSAAVAMARLHTSRTSAFAEPPRTAAADIKQVRDRAARIAEANPSEAGRVLAMAQRLSCRLEAAEPDSVLPGHGSFKPTQLLVRDRDALVVDLDAFALADPAADVGCFMAYLRPSSLWYRRSGLRLWFDRAAHDFVHGYRRAMVDLGVAPSHLDGILERTRAYEGAKLFRIAVRHVTRQNSPRPQELAAICSDIGECLDNPSRWRTASMSGRGRAYG